MVTTRRNFIGYAAALTAMSSLALAAPAYADTAEELNSQAAMALENLYSTNPVAKNISEEAEAVLIFPNIVKAGLVFGGAYGEGVLQEDGKVVDYYNSVTGSWGLQAGAQSYGYAVFLMNDEAVDYIRETDGWEIGVGPTVVVVDEGAAKNLSTSTLKDDAYAFVFNQQGLMAGVSIEGSKITKINR
ncbi:YSC84-related protein [Parvibaculum sp.]|uniref:lipid-binding SYLF domain-containing protein n=1 Tax=Parvibaculum sp. TaxID=2024848 RepID=UPI003C74E70D